MNFYRIKQIDKDGRSAFSAIAKLMFTKKTMDIKSNIVNNSVEVNYTGSNIEQLNFYNAVGALVFVTKISGSKLINLSFLPGGLYFIKNNQGDITRFVKQ